MKIHQTHFFSGILGVVLAKVINVEIFDLEWQNSFFVELPIVLFIYLIIWFLFLRKKKFS